MRIQKWILPAFLLVSFGARAEDLSLIPMYGSTAGKKKGKELQESDARFIKEITKLTGSKAKAYDSAMERGWAALFQQNDANTAVRRFNQAWMLDSSRHEAYWGFGVYHGLKGEVAESIPMLEKAQKIAPKSAKVLNNLGISYTLMAEREPKKAAEWNKKALGVLEKAHKIAPKDSNIAMNYGLSLYTAGKTDQAKPLLQQAKAGGEKSAKLDAAAAKLQLRVPAGTR